MSERAYIALLDSLHISEDDIAFFRDENAGLCGVEKSRVSQFLLAQLTSAYKHRVLNSFAITDVIQKLEGAGRDGLKVREEPFKHAPLKGFWKAHFFDASFLMKNLINEWGLEFKESKKFEALCVRVIAEEEGHPSPRGWQGRLAHELAISGYESRAKDRKITGEWVIFGKHENKNYYLCVAKHSASKDGDEEIYGGIKYLCRSEYPFLF